MGTEQQLPPTSWWTTETNVIIRFLCKNHEMNGLSSEDIRNAVDYAWEASRYNPSWGPRRLCALKLLSAKYKETRFHEDAFRINKNKSFDVGGMQINSVHWFGVARLSEWGRFCRMMRLDPNDVKNLWNPEINTQFAALLNEDFIQSHHSTYDYYKTPEQRKLYDLMVGAIGFKQIALKHADKQYREAAEN